ncbi:MAG TPA: tRNA (adenosine(37)-N6)-threonylcarbamoyltransferase complex dimerization subunit type 1 TsaB [Candidatus Sulfotelmatobacter sp.]
MLLITDTSGRNGTVALARVGESDDVQVLEVVPLAGGMFSAQLVPQIASLLQNHGLTKSHIAAFVVVSGPGSFTGLRVGLAAIKALAEILQKPIVPVSLLELVAAESRAQGKVVAALDGGRHEVFFGAYNLAGELLQVLREELLSQPDFVSSARDSTVVTPDAALAAIARDAGLTVVMVQNPNSEMIAGFGWKKLRAGATVSPDQLEASYMRRSDAEMFVKQNS